MDKIKEAFYNVRQDIDFLKQEISILNENLLDIIREIKHFREFESKIQENLNSDTPTDRHIIPTDRHIIPREQTHIQTHNTGFTGLKDQISPISNGNVGVPTDRQTDRQTDRHIIPTNKHIQNTQENEEFQDILEILDSLDNKKKEIRLKFKRLTDQEFLIFSTLYQLQDSMEVNYKILAEKLGLSESSIRDYVGKLIKKGVPLEKVKLNNKNIQLIIPEDFKKIASLSTILQLRNI
jgi:biotin operon repressor